MGETADAEKGDRGLDGRCSMIKGFLEQCLPISSLHLGLSGSAGSPGPAGTLKTSSTACVHRCIHMLRL